MIERLRWKSTKFVIGAPLTLVCMVIISILIFGVRPVVIANDYSQKLQAQAITLSASFKQIAKTSQLKVFNVADTTTKSSDLNAVIANISSAQSQLANFKQTASDLQTTPHVALGNSYRNAKYSRQHSLDVINQASDVLNQYQELATFLKAYYPLEQQYVTLTADLNSVNNLDSLKPQADKLYSDSQRLADMAGLVSSLSAPEGFESLKSQAKAVYEMASRGEYALASGLSTDSDSEKNTGARLIEQSTRAHDDNLTGLPTENAQGTNILTLVGNLPDKTNSIITAANSGY